MCMSVPELLQECCNVSNITLHPVLSVNIRSTFDKCQTWKNGTASPWSNRLPLARGCDADTTNVFSSETYTQVSPVLT